jgi:hypothetical protein
MADAERLNRDSHEKGTNFCNCAMTNTKLMKGRPKIVTECVEMPKESSRRSASCLFHYLEKY